MDKRYKIISPNMNDKIIQTSSVNKCAKYCYKQIKQNNIRTNSFTIKDIDSNQHYTFAINHNKHIQLGGDDAEQPQQSQPQQSQQQQQVQPPETSEILKKIEQRLENIERKLELNNANVCSIM